MSDPIYVEVTTPAPIVVSLTEAVVVLPGGGGVVDATTSVKGIVKLAGDLGGTADLPTVPGLAAKAPLASPAFTGTPTGITKSHVGLGNVDNTSDVNKPVSTAQATAIGLKSDLASPTFTGDPKAPTPATADNDTSIATTAFVKAQAYAPLASPAFTGTPTGITKSHVGLANVDNTSDANKPVSTATQTELDLKAPKANPVFSGSVFVPDASFLIGKVSGLQAALDAKAPLASPALTGNPTAPTATAGDNDTSIATTAFVTAAVAAGGGGGVAQVGEVAVGSWLAPFNEMANSTALTGVIGTEYAIQIILNESETFDQIATRLWSGHNASLVARVGIYADAGGGPSVNVTHDLGTIPLTASGFSSAAIGSPPTLAAGVWWLTIVQQVGTAAIWTKASQPKWPNPAGASDLTSGSGYYTRTGSTGALSGNTGAWSLVTGLWNQNFAAVALRRSA